MNAQMKENTGNVIGLFISAGFTSEMLQDAYSFFDKDKDQMVMEEEFILGAMQLSRLNVDKHKAAVYAAEAIVYKYAFWCEVGDTTQKTNECFELLQLTLNDCQDAWMMWKTMALGAHGPGCGPILWIIIGSVAGIAVLGAVAFVVLSGDDNAGSASG